MNDKLIQPKPKKRVVRQFVVEEKLNSERRAGYIFIAILTIICILSIIALQ